MAAAAATIHEAGRQEGGDCSAVPGPRMDPDMELQEEAWSLGTLDSENQHMASHVAALQAPLMSEVGPQTHVLEVIMNE